MPEQLIINTENDYQESLQNPSKEKWLHFSYLLSPLQYTVFKTFDAMLALLIATEEPYTSIILPGLISPFVFINNYATYSETAALETGTDILNKDHKIEYIQNPIGCYIKDFGTTLSSAEAGFIYGYNFFSNFFNQFPYFMKVIIGFYTALIVHRTDLKAESRVWSLRRQVKGEPGYENTIGKFWDFTDSLIPLPGLPKKYRKKIAIENFSNDSYPNFKAIMQMMASEYLLQNVLEISLPLSFFISWLLPFNGAEFVYVSSYSQKIMKYSLPTDTEEKYKTPQWRTKIREVFIFLMSVVNGRYTAAFWGIFIDPITLYKFSKMAGEVIIGTAAAYQIKQKIPRLMLLLAEHPGFYEIKIEIPHLVNNILLTYAAIQSFYIGYICIKAAESRFIGQDEINFSKKILEEYDILDEQKEETTYAQKVYQRANGLYKVFTKNLTSLAGLFSCCRRKIPVEMPLDDLSARYDLM